MQYQLEKGAEAGTKHYQGFVLFKERKSLAQMKILFPGAHLEVMRGTIADNVNYCSKGLTYLQGPWEVGTKPKGQGSRTDLLECQQMIKDGKSEKDIADEHFGTWTKSYRAFERYRRLIVKERSPVPLILNVPFFLRLINKS